MKKLNTVSYTTLDNSDTYQTKALLKDDGVLILKQETDLIALTDKELKSLYNMLTEHFKSLT